MTANPSRARAKFPNLQFSPVNALSSQLDARPLGYGAMKSLEAGSGDVSKSMIITTHTNFITHFAFSFISTYLVGIQNEEKRSTFKYVQSSLWKYLLSW